VRCFAPRPGARAPIRDGPLQGRWLKVLQGMPMTAEADEAGRCSANHDGIVVQCGQQSAYLIRRLQPEGKAAMDASAFWHGLRGAPLRL